MFGIVRLIFSGAREFIQERTARKRLERQLGRPVSRDELYSLGSHLDAAQQGAQAMPSLPQGGASSPYQPAVPFGNARPPMSTRTKLVIGAALVLVVGFVGVVAVAGLAVMNMSSSTYYKLNPFTPKAPLAAFPAEIGKYTRAGEPEYSYSEFSPEPLKEYFHTYYKGAEAGTLYLYVWDYKTESEAQAGFEAKKKQMKAYQGYQHVDDSASRLASVWLKNGSTSVTWIDGTKLKNVYGAPQNIIYEFEGVLRNGAPAQVVDVRVEEPMTPAGKTSDSTSSPSLTVAELLDAYKKDQSASDAKYKNKIVQVSGRVAVSEKDKKGNWMIAFLRPDSTNPGDGMVVCSFDKSKEASVSSIKKGDSVRLEGKVSMFLVFSVMLENCSKP